MNSNTKKKHYYGRVEGKYSNNEFKGVDCDEMRKGSSYKEFEGVDYDK